MEVTPTTVDPVLLEGLVKRLQAKDGPLRQCSKAISRLITDMELAVESLEEIADDINSYNQSEEIKRATKYCYQLGGGVVAAHGIKGMLDCGISDILSSIGILLGTSSIVIATAGLRHLNRDLDRKVNSIVENQVVPLMDRLQDSIKELQVHWKGVAGVCATLCVSTVSQMTWINYLDSLDTPPSTITPVKSSANALRSIWAFVQDKRHPTAEQIINQLLPQLHQQIKDLKDAKQQLDKMTSQISDVTSATNKPTDLLQL